MLTLIARNWHSRQPRRRGLGLAVGLDPDAGLRLDADQDLARRAARALGTPAFSALAARSGLDGRELARRGLAWQHGSAAGLELLHAGWDPPAGKVVDERDTQPAMPPG